MTEKDMIIDADLNAYVDGQLDTAARLRVETYLADNPQAAARVMTDLSMRTSLKLAMSSNEMLGRAETREAARRLSANLDSRRKWAVVQRIAAVAVLVSVGWLANSSIGPFAPREVNASVRTPPLLEEAIRAHETALVRQGMPSQPQVRAYEREDIRAATAIVMPELPNDWQVDDVQIFPSEFGPSVEARLHTGEGMVISLFAVRPGHFAVEPVKDISMANAEAAWWQIGDVAYAVVSSNAKSGLADEAELLKKSLY
ncbi:anti-sigma factor [Neorhizobium alkalisoli]|uniref:Anti-sigma factor RsiW n=1 Tax=Neorhizobium alkalisoli TaxID=528178 RepID=A0A561QGF6_9HYPH|nr:anti-sigma factor [Neorhizobium alkalisoli]TWF49467.1 anti-sigma factor RsiW [Neorhizobium alkalisoli]